jgi:HSP20 family protein
LNINRLDPYSDVAAVQDRIHRLLEEAQAPPREGRAPSERNWRPPVDIHEAADEVKIYLDLPGLQQESMNIHIMGENLTVHGERRQEKLEGSLVVHAERPEGAFHRSFTLGISLQADKVQASYRDGVLVITLPKAEAVKPRKVEIELEAGAGARVAGKMGESKGTVTSKVTNEVAGKGGPAKGKTRQKVAKAGKP